jgi:hypothetical protein
MKYISNATGRTPYSTKVTMAPSTVPRGWVASATAIITATYIQARGIRYIEALKSMLHCNIFDGILRVNPKNDQETR